MIKIWFKKILLCFILSIAIIISIIAQNVPFECSSDAYFTHHDSGNDNLFRFTPDFDYTLIKKLDFSINGISYNPKDNFIYGLNESLAHIVRVDKNGDYIDLGLPTGLQGNSYWAGTCTQEGTVVISGGTGAWIVELDITVTPPAIINANPKFYADGSPGEPSLGDIAIDPTSGICYSIDNATRKLATINLTTGAVTTFGATLNFSTNANGALYFDGSGELTAFYLKDIYKIDKTNGAAILAGEGLDVANGIDACGCLNPIQFDKVAEPAQACAGDTVTFTFSIINNSEIGYSDITFSDPIPIDLEVVELPSNTFGGNVDVTNLANNFTVVSITDMEIPVGISEFTIKTIATGNPSNLINVINQARIAGFVPAWESIIDSNNPLTTAEGDGTAISISPTLLLDFDLQSIGGGCEGTPISLIANVNHQGNYEWELPNGSISNEQIYSQSNATINDDGLYNITFTDDFGCQIDSSLTIEILPAPTVNLGNDSLVCLQTPFSIHVVDNENITWQDGSTSPFFLIEDYGNYSVEVMNEFGCLASDTITFSSGCLADLYVPNAFSPNGDGNNDIFFAYGLDVVDFNLKVFDRWGASLFESNDIAIGWDGLFKGKLKSEGVYVWVIEASFLNGESIIKKGDVTLLK